MLKKILFAAVAAILVFSVNGFCGEPATSTPQKPGVMDIGPSGEVCADKITANEAIDFLAQITGLGMEEMEDNSLEAMICTPHALPRKLFFQALCDCSTDPETKVSDLEILALNEEMERSGECDDEVHLTLNDVNQGVTSGTFFYENPAADVNTVSFPQLDTNTVATQGLPDGWTNQILRSGSVSF